MKRIDKMKLKALVSDYIKYTFGSTIGFALCVFAQCSAMCMAVIAYRSQPRVVLILLSITTGIFLFVMLISYIRFKSYRDHYSKVFNK
jgi:hypothetical protein